MACTLQDEANLAPHGYVPLLACKRYPSDGPFVWSRLSSNLYTSIRSCVERVGWHHFRFRFSRLISAIINMGSYETAVVLCAYHQDSRTEVTTRVGVILEGASAPFLAPRGMLPVFVWLLSA